MLFVVFVFVFEFVFVVACGVCEDLLVEDAFLRKII